MGGDIRVYISVEISYMIKVVESIVNMVQWFILPSL